MAKKPKPAERKPTIPTTPPQQTFTPGTYIPGPKVRRMFGISGPTLWRWQRDPQVRLPMPATIIKRRNYYDAGEIARWLASQQQARPEAA